MVLLHSEYFHRSKKVYTYFRGMYLSRVKDNDNLYILIKIQKHPQKFSKWHNEFKKRIGGYIIYSPIYPPTFGVGFMLFSYSYLDWIHTKLTADLRNIKDKTIADKLMWFFIDDTHNYSFFRFQLVVEFIGAKLNDPTNQILIKVSKVVNPTLK